VPPVPESIVTVPLIVAVAVAEFVKLILPPEGPIVSVVPAETLKALVRVIVLPLAAPARVQVPLTVKLLSVIVGTAVMLALWVLLIMTTSPATGVPLFQFPAVVHTPPVVGVQVVVFALAVAAAKNMASSNSSGNCRDVR